MKYIVFSLIVILLSCKTQNQTSIEKSDYSKEKIAYFFPESVLKIIKINIDKDKNYIFDLRKDGSFYELFIAENTNNFFAQRTSRFCVVNGNIFPIILDYDEDFGSTKEFEEAIKQKDVTTKSHTIYDNVFMIKFNKQGKICYAGSSFSSPKNCE
jgi:hypothetical protein